MVGYRLLTSRSTADAHLLVGALQCEGIDARLQRDGLGAVYGLTFGAFATHVFVPVAQYDVAVVLLAEWD